KLFPKKIHATTLNGFLLKIALFLFAYQVNKAFIQ
ncbi:MAG: IS982 family transposase, partial [Pyrinomonadaceae bacterium]